MAFAAVRSLLDTIESLLDSCRISVASSTRESLESAHDHASSLERKLECCSEGITEMDELIIIEEARKLEDAIEFPLSTLFLSLSESRECCFPTFNQLEEDIDCFAKTAKEMEENIEKLWQQKAAKMIQEYIEELFVPKEEEQEEDYDDYGDGDDYDVSSECDMVGLSDQFRMIRKTLVPPPNQSPPLQIISQISGMAGIGKTMLAKKIYHDPLVKANFDYRAFVRVGQEFRVKEVLQAIAAQLDPECKKIIMDLDDRGLFNCLVTRLLPFRRSLIVLDDVWDLTILDILKGTIDMMRSNGSRILVTSRTDINEYSFLKVFKMRFMNEEESWELLRRNVFGDSECPPQLVKAGKKIAEKCEGLPLLIIAVAPILLSKAQRNVEDWNRVAEKPRSVLEVACDKISEVLLSSYHRLTEESKLCFLYIAAFPLNYIVRCSRIINLWYAERFNYLHFFGTLHETNLVTIHQISWRDDKTKACSLHCAYWYVSKRVAKNNRFLYTIDSDEDGLDKCVESHRRLAIYTNVMFAIKEVHNKIASVPTVRSLLCTGPYHQYQVPICWEWRLLRILDALSIRYYEFPIEVVKLIRLRYLALTCNANLPPSISKLWNLEFLIVHQHVSIKRVVAADHESYLPVEIWKLQELEHLEITRRNLPDPPHPGAVLPNLTKLLGVGVESCTKAVLGSIPHLKKLRIQIELAPDVAETLSGFDHISCLRELESLQSVVMNPALLRPPPPLSIPKSYLRKLSLSGLGYPWKEMSKISHLPNLRVLKLQSYAFRGEKWEVEEMGFQCLLYLLIEDTDLVQWIDRDGTSFEILLRLRMKNCHKLQEIPYFTSNSIAVSELVDCNPLAEICVKQHQSKKGRYLAANVTANYSWKEEKGVKTL